MITIQDWKDFKDYRNKFYNSALKNLPEIPKLKTVKRKFLFFKWEEKIYPTKSYLFAHQITVDYFLGQVPKLTIENCLSWVADGKPSHFPKWIKNKDMASDE